MVLGFGDVAFAALLGKTLPVFRPFSNSYPQFSTELSTSMWKTSAVLWIDVENFWINPIFPDWISIFSAFPKKNHSRVNVPPLT